MTEHSTSRVDLTWNVSKNLENISSSEQAEFLLNVVLKQHVQIVAVSSDGELSLFDDIQEDGFIALNELKPNTKYAVKVDAVLNFEPLQNTEFKVDVESLLGTARTDASPIYTAPDVVFKVEDSYAPKTPKACDVASSIEPANNDHQGKGDTATCQECGKVFLSIYQLNAHKRVHIKSRPFSCEVCTKTFASSMCRNVHIKKIHGLKSSKLNKTKDVAEVKVKRRKAVTQQPTARKAEQVEDIGTNTNVIKEELDESENLLKSLCEIVDSYIPKEGKKEPSKRIRTKPKVLKDYDCSGFGESVLAASTLDVPKTAHYESTCDKTYTCDVCQKQFAWGASLLRHQRKFHVAGKPFKCRVCHQTFDLRSTLKSHSKTHVKPGSASCDVCHKVFVSAAYLRYHMRLHSTEQRYACEVCNSSFSSASLLNYHKEKKHGEQMQYKCNVCGEEFSWQKELFKHEMEHIDQID